MSHSRKTLFILVACSLLLFGFLLMTNPNDLALGYLVIPIILIMTVSYLFIKLIVDYLRLFQRAKVLKNVINITLPLLITGAIVFQSIGGLNVGEVILLIAFCVTSVFYVVKLL